MESGKDCFPLLCTYVEPHKTPEEVRRKTMTQSTAAILGRWPTHVTFSALMSLVGIFCILLSIPIIILMLMFTSPRHDTTDPDTEHFCSDTQFGLRLEDLNIDSAENSTFFIHMSDGEDRFHESACSIESFITASSPGHIFYIHVGDKKDLLDLTPEHLQPLLRLNARYKNLSLRFFNTYNFFRGTHFETLAVKSPQKFLGFLAKLLLAWTFGGVVVDTDCVTLRRFSRGSQREEDLVLWLGREDLDVLDAGRFCHAFVFEMMRVILEMKPHSPGDVVATAVERFCRGKASCPGVKLNRAPLTCDNSTRTGSCVFMNLDPSDQHLPCHSILGARVK